MHRALRVRRLVGPAGLLAALTIVAAGPALASGSVGISVTLTEPVGGPIHSAFSCPASDACGGGEVLGLGQVSETIVFGGPGGPGFDVRTVTFADGSRLVLDEQGSNPSVPGRSYHSVNSYGNPFHLDLTDVVDGAASTGSFAGASGTLSGSVSLAGGMAIIGLAGTVTTA